MNPLDYWIDHNDAITAAMTLAATALILLGWHLYELYEKRKKLFKDQPCPVCGGPSRSTQDSPLAADTTSTSLS